MSKCSLNCEVVHARRSAEEHVVTLARRVRRGDLFQRVPQHAVREREAIDGEVRLEHAPPRREAFDRVFVVAPLERDELVGRRRTRGGVESETIVRHRQTTDLGDHVVALCDLVDVNLPLVEDLLASLGVDTDAERRAEVVEHQHRVGHRARQRREFTVLVVVVPGVVDQRPSPESGHARAKRWVAVLAFGGATGNHQRLGVRIACSRVADPAQQSITGVAVRVESLVEVRRIRQIGVGDETGDEMVGITRRGLGNELGLAHRLQVRRSVTAIAGAALHEHRVLDAVSAGDVSLELVETVW